MMPEKGSKKGLVSSLENDYPLLENLDLPNPMDAAWVASKRNESGFLERRAFK